MKRTILFFIILTITFIFYKCDDSGITNQNDRSFKIAGIISNWTLGTKIIKATASDSLYVNTFTADSSLINSDGSFALSLKNPPDNFIYMISFTDTVCISNIQISPAGLKFTYMTINVYNDSNSQIGGVIRKNYDDTLSQGSFWNDYEYFNSDASINGNSTCIFTNDTFKAVYNLTQLKKGWNKIVILDYIQNQSYTEFHFDLNEPAGGKWYFHPYLSGFSKKHFFGK